MNRKVLRVASHERCAIFSEYLVSNNWIMTNESKQLLKIYNTVFLVLQFVATRIRKRADSFAATPSAQIDEI